MNRKIGRGVTAILAGCGIAVFAGVGVASAHIHADPAAVEGGSVATVGFGVEHGCDGSPTTGVDIKMPEGITDAAPVPMDGWEAVVDADVVRFSGGSLDAETPASFAITFTAPTDAGVINFPIVQTCEEGSIDWLDIAVEGEEEPERPAPSLLITAGPPTEDDLGDHGEETVATTGSTAEEGDHHAEEGAATGDESDSDDDGSNTGLIIGVVVAAAVVGGGAGYLVARKRRGTGGTGTGTAGSVD